MVNDDIYENISGVMDGAMAVSLFNTDVLFTRLPEDLMSYLQDEVRAVQDNFETAASYSHNLAGHIEREYLLNHCRPRLNDFIVTHVAAYDRRYKIIPDILTVDCAYSIDDMWVNFQKKHEFNPPHTHSGFCSFVIWMKIPYNLCDEDAVFPNGRARQTSRFGFITTNRMGKIETDTVPIDKGFEGVICFFPSSMVHYVNPFYTSDDYRISISGNVAIYPDRIIREDKR